MKLKKCKVCGSGDVVLENFGGIYFVICHNCKNSTPDADNKRQAIRFWNNTIADKKN